MKEVTNTDLLLDYFFIARILASLQLASTSDAKQSFVPLAFHFPSDERQCPSVSAPENIVMMIFSSFVDK